MLERIKVIMTTEILRNIMYRTAELEDEKVSAVVESTEVLMATEIPVQSCAMSACCKEHCGDHDCRDPAQHHVPHC